MEAVGGDNHPLRRDDCVHQLRAHPWSCLSSLPPSLSLSRLCLSVVGLLGTAALRRLILSSFFCEQELKDSEKRVLNQTQSSGANRYSGVARTTG